MISDEIAKEKVLSKQRLGRFMVVLTKKMRIYGNDSLTHQIIIIGKVPRDSWSFISFIHNKKGTAKRRC